MLFEKVTLIETFEESFFHSFIQKVWFITLAFSFFIVFAFIFRLFWLILNDLIF